MIFVTVGTHEQPFNRLLREVDRLAGEKKIKEQVFMQTGFSNYCVKNCKTQKFLSNDEMDNYFKKARIIITHGGPASFITPIQHGKIPIVVPRQKVYKEHVNNHQVDFVKFISKKLDNIIPVYDISELNNAIASYSQLSREKSANLTSHNLSFNNELENIIDELFYNA